MLEKHSQTSRASVPCRNLLGFLERHAWLWRGSSRPALDVTFLLLRFSQLCKCFCRVNRGEISEVVSKYFGC